MKRDILRFLLSAVLMTCCAFSASAQLGTPPNDEIWYTTKGRYKLNDSDYEVGKTLCSLKIIEHGNEFLGHCYIKFDGDVTAISNKAFYDQDDLTAVSFPNTVVQIGGATDGTGVFEDCDNLESVTVPASVKYIGRCAFYDCVALKSFSCDNVEIIYPEAFYNCENLKSVNLGTKLKEIKWSSQGNAYGAFEDCDALETITIPSSVTHIGKRAFYWCNSLKFVAIGSGVREIAEAAFYNCNELKSVAFDGNVTTIGEDAFNDCEKLESVAFLGNTPPSSFGEDCFDDCSPNLKYYVLEENYNSYNGNSSLRGKVVAGPPYNEIWYITNNGETAGYSLNGEYSPKLNAYLDNHGVQFFNGNPPELSYSENCFWECNNLVSAVLPSSITNIGPFAFNHCSSLVSVSIPSTVTGIDKFAFSNCPSLQNIILPEGLNYIGEYAFSDCSGLLSITIPNKVNTIPQSAFADCSALQSVSIGNSVTSIGASAFEYCTAMNSVTMGNSVTNIGELAFHQCTSIQNITFPDGLNYIGELAFSFCSGLQSITIPDKVNTIPKYAFCNCSALKSVTIGNGVTSIGESAFEYCAALQSVTIGNSVTSIGELAFYSCDALQSVTFRSVPLMDEFAFYGCNNLSSKVLDLTDSDKPYIGTSLANYPKDFSEARYHRTLEQGKWGTIVLPFTPTAGLEGLEFYELKGMTANDDGSLVFTKVNALQTGVPYLVKNVSDSKTDFTLTKTRPSITLTPQNQTAGDITMKGSFQTVQLNGAENRDLYYLKDNEFYHANGKINISPFRAYIEGDANGVKSLMLVVEDGETTAVPGIMDKDGNIDETEAIYDLSGRKLAAPVKGQINIIRMKSGKTVKRMF